jgi:hypothetical protein
MRKPSVNDKSDNSCGSDYEESINVMARCLSEETLSTSYSSDNEQKLTIDEEKQTSEKDVSAPILQSSPRRNIIIDSKKIIEHNRNTSFFFKFYLHINEI